MVGLDGPRSVFKLAEVRLAVVGLRRQRGQADTRRGPCRLQSFAQFAHVTTSLQTLANGEPIPMTPCDDKAT
ncbi:hypothetical protein GCM10023192_24200 [Amycolatopsis samaneae]